jgi:hypothetical protein
MSAARSLHPLAGDLRHIEAALGLPRYAVGAVERRSGGDYALLLHRPALTRWQRDHPRDWRLLPIAARRVLRIPRGAVHARTRRWRSRNRRLFRWAFTHAPLSPAAEPERLERTDRVLDELRAAIVRESHRGTMRQGYRELTHQ